MFFRPKFGLVVASVRRCAGRTFRGWCGRVMVVILAFEDSLAGVFRSKFGFGCGKRAPVRWAHLPWWAGARDGWNSRVRGFACGGCSF